MTGAALVGRAACGVNCHGVGGWRIDANERAALPSLDVEIHPRGVAMQEYQLYIAGEFGPSKSGKTVDSINPATEEPWARVARAGREDAQRAIKAARTAFDSGPWSRMSQADRARLLDDLADRLQARAPEIAVLGPPDPAG